VLFYNQKLTTGQRKASRKQAKKNQEILKKVLDKPKILWYNEYNEAREKQTTQALASVVE
jgi:hypothetical protein